jgi:DNA-directed RNA polymerase specialized sigma24 family protein
MAEETDLASLSISSLCHRCAIETDQFFHRKRHDPRYCFELFRRAIIDQNQRAWDFLFSQYRPLVTGWVERHTLFPACGEESEFFVNWAFEKLWSVMTPEKLARFPNLKSILQYLQMCVHSVIVDYMRGREQAELLADLNKNDLPAKDREAISPEREALRQIHASELWRMLNGKLKDEKERKVVYGSFVLAMKPGELIEHYNGDFEDVNDIYRVKENVLARFRRDDELKDFLR